MISKKTILKTLVILIALILLILSKQGICDDAGDPFSSELSGNIGAWYDETYQARGFFRLEREQAGSDNFHYVHIPNATTSNPTAHSEPTFVKEGTKENKETQETNQHKHNYTDATAGASMPQDIVVTEWWVTGHVHFAHQ